MSKKKDFLYKYMNAYSPVGKESEGQNIWKEYIEPYCDQVKTDAYGTTYGVLKGKFNTWNKRVVIEAHCDEIAWIITHIQDDGYIRVKRHGGSDNMIAPSMPVVIHTEEGDKVDGVFGWPAIHTRKSAVEKGYDQHELWVDTGLKDKEAVLNAGVEVGNVITFKSEFSELGDYYMGKSLDNKIGGYIIAEVLRKIKESGIELPYDLYIVNSVQEEVGLHGATMIAKTLRADLALVHDVCHNTNTPKIDKAKDGDIKGGEGPCIEYTAQNHRGINKMLVDLASKHNIKLQKTVGSYGNDTMAFFLENTPTAILATPLKYMHTTVEMAHKKDVRSCIKLYIKFLTNLTREDIEKINNNEL